MTIMLPVSSYLSVEVALEVDAGLCSEVKWSTDWGLWCNIANIGRYYHNGWWFPQHSLQPHNHPQHTITVVPFQSSLFSPASSVQSLVTVALLIPTRSYCLDAGYLDSSLALCLHIYMVYLALTTDVILTLLRRIASTLGTSSWDNYLPTLAIKQTFPLLQGYNFTVSVSIPYNLLFTILSLRRSRLIRWYDPSKEHLVFQSKFLIIHLVCWLIQVYFTFKSAALCGGGASRDETISNITSSTSLTVSTLRRSQSIPPTAVTPSLQKQQSLISAKLGWWCRQVNRMVDCCTAQQHPAPVLLTTNLTNFYWLTVWQL